MLYKPTPPVLIPLPIIGVLLEWVGMDLVGPLPKSTCSHEYILVIMDYTTSYPEAISLCKAMSKNIAYELMIFFSQVGILRDLPSHPIHIQVGSGPVSVTAGETTQNLCLPLPDQQACQMIEPNPEKDAA